MSTLTKIARVISAAISSTPALSALDPKGVYGGLLPAGVTQGVTIDGSFAIEAKQKQRGYTIHLFRPLGTKPQQAGDIEDMADALVAALKGSPILTSNWTRQPDSANNIDHVVFPVVIYLDLLP